MSRMPLAAVALCALAFALRIWHLEFQSLWWDEGVSIYLAGQGVRALTIDKDFGVDIHPPLYHLVLAVWTWLVSPSVFTSRLLSVFSGVLTVPLTVQCTSTLLGLGTRKDNGALSGWPRLVAPLVAGLLAAVSPIDVFYSQESRMYPFLPVVGAASILATVGVIRSGTWRRWLVWIAMNLAGLYVFYYLGLLALAESVVLLVLSVAAASRARIWTWLRRWGISQLVVVLGFAPWLLIVARRLGGTSLALPTETEVHLTPWRFALESWTAYTIGFTLPPGGDALLVLWALLVIAGAVLLARASPIAACLSVVVLLLPVVAAGLIVLIRPFYYPRFVLFALVPLWALVAIGATEFPLEGWTWIRRRIAAGPLGAHGCAPLPGVVVPYATSATRSASALVLVLLLAGSAWTWSHERTTARIGYAPDDYRTVFASMSERLQAGDLIFGGYPWQAGYARAYFWRLAPRTEYVKPPIDPTRLGNILASGSRAWLVSYSPDHQFTLDSLEAALTRLGPTTFVDQNGDSRARLFQTKSAVVVPPTPPLATFDREIALQRMLGPMPKQAIAGSSVSEVLGWRALSPPSGDYTVFVHVVGPDGKLWGQVDSPPIHGSFPTRGWTAGLDLIDRYVVALDPHAPPGIYDVEVGMYRPDSGQRLTVGPSPVTANRIVVGSFEVVAR
jgi:mannosyltransferase